jgi:hypothetical protein
MTTRAPRSSALDSLRLLIIEHSSRIIFQEKTR